MTTLGELTKVTAIDPAADQAPFADASLVAHGLMAFNQAWDAGRPVARVRLEKTSDQTIGSQSTNVLVTWQTAAIDTHGFADLDNNQIVIPPGWGGYYLIQSVIRFSYREDTIMNRLYRDSTELNQYRIARDLNTGTAANMPALWLGPVAAGETIKTYAYITGSSTRTVTGANTVSYLHALFIGK